MEAFYHAATASAVEYLQQEEGEHPEAKTERKALPPSTSPSK
jgi:hypothetical protein